MKIKHTINFSRKFLLFLFLFFSLINFVYCLLFLNAHLYLPSPFMIDKNDTLMDFYNPLFWVINEGFYTIFNSIYPPINYFILFFFANLFDVHAAINAFELREKNLFLSQVLILFYIYIIFLAVSRGYWKRYSFNLKLLWFLIFVLSSPVLYGLERGNTIFFALFFLVLYLDSTDDIKKAIYLSLLINIKPYFIILLLQYLNKNQFNKKIVVYTFFISVAIFFITGYFAKINFLKFFEAYLVFSEKSSLSANGVLSMAHSISSLLYFKDYMDNPSLLGFYSSFNFWFSLIKIFNILIVLILIYICLIGKLSKNYLMLASFVIICNFSVSTGPYVIISYIPIFALVMRSFEYKFFALSIIGLIVVPWDWIPFYHLHFASIDSYLAGGINLVNLELNIGLGSIVRPFINMSMMIYLIIRSNLFSKKLKFFN